MMVWIGSGPIPISTSHITIKTFSFIVKGRVADLLRLTSTSFTISPNINSLVFMKTIINMNRSTRYILKSTMYTWVMVVRLSSLGPIYTSQITIKILSNVDRGKVAGFF